MGSNSGTSREGHLGGFSDDADRVSVQLQRVPRRDITCLWIWVWIWVLGCGSWAGS